MLSYDVELRRLKRQLLFFEGTYLMDNDQLYGLIEQEIPRLRRYAMFLARDPEWGDDLVQECLVRAIANIDKWQPGTNMRSWLMTILHNIFVNETKKRRPIVTHDGTIERANPISGTQEIRHEMRDVQRAFECLSWQHRQIVWFICVEQMGYNEVAEALNVPVGTVRSRLCRAREHLKRLIDEGSKNRPRQRRRRKPKIGRSSPPALRTGTRG